MVWKDWLGKRVFVQLKSGGYYTGDIVKIDEDPYTLTFFTLIDKFGFTITFVHSEIVKIVEEEK